LGILISQRESEGVNNKELLSEEADAKMDIYDYCARFDTVPVFTMIERGRKKQRIFEVTVKMTEQDIEGSAKAKDRRKAEILACVDFKKKAEEYHSKYGDENIVVKDALALNSRNARKFFEYYKMMSKDAHYDVKIVSIGKKGSAEHQGQMMLNDRPIGKPVSFLSKKNAETGAYLAGAVGLKEEFPELFPKFQEALRQGNGELLKPVLPSWIKLEQNTMAAMTDTLVNARRVGLPPTEAEEARMEEEEERNRRQPPRKKLDPAFVPIKSKKLLDAYKEYLNDPALESLRKKRQELPMNQYQAKVLDLVNNHSVSIIVGATGSGKTSKYNFV
jgi:ATP-dependent RNA helicase DHX36